MVLPSLAGRGGQLRKQRRQTVDGRQTIADGPAGAASGMIIGTSGAERADS